MHCVSSYPVEKKEANLLAIKTLKKHFKNCIIGYSDHTIGIFAPLVAVAFGASIIEKHFTLDISTPGPDHKASLEPTTFRQMIKAIREVEQLLGDGKKRAQNSELKNIVAARKSLVAATDISAGELFTKNNVAIKRPATGRDPMDYWDLLNEICVETIKADELIP